MCNSQNIKVKVNSFRYFGPISILTMVLLLYIHILSMLTAVPQQSQSYDNFQLTQWQKTPGIDLEIEPPTDYRQAGQLPRM